MGQPTDARSLVASTMKDVYQKVRIIGDTQLIPNDTVSVRKGLSADMVKQIQQGLLELAGTKEGFEGDTHFRFFFVCSPEYTHRRSDDQACP